MAEIKTYNVTIGQLYNGDELCKNPTVELIDTQDVSINCIDENAGVYQIQVGPDATEPCLTFRVKCEDSDCNICPEEIITKCFCDDSDDCPDCSVCIGGVCSELCPPEECVDGVCTDCESITDCPCNQVCNNGNCECPVGTTLNPDTGCCDECTGGDDCGPCEICQNVNGANICVPKECTDGVCDPATDTCVECLNSGDCLGDNECCVGKECVCCTGYRRVNGVCVPKECDFDEDCPDCQICVDGYCTDIQCPDGQTCIDGECKPDCSDGCPEGQGCLDGVCVPCDTLSCNGAPSPCQRAEGCDCDETNNCEAVDCATSDDCAEWVVTPAMFVPGDPNGDPGMPAIVFVTEFEDLGIVQIDGDGAFRDYRITVTTGSVETGQWNVEGGYNATGTSISFTLSQTGPVQWNNVGFEVNFTETGGTGRTGSIVIYNTNWDTVDPTDLNAISTLLTDPATWVVDVQSNAIAPGTGNGTVVPGSLQLCACNPNTAIIDYSWTTTEGNLTVKVYPNPNNQCSNVVIQGCGAGNGTLTLDCAGKRSTIPMPELPYDYSSSTCCDPITDPDCTGIGDGEGCQTTTTVTGDLVLAPFNNNIWVGVLQALPGEGLSRPRLVRAARNFCWSTSGNMTVFNGYPSFPGQFQHVTYNGGAGCLRLGYSCDISLGGCKILQAEVCLEKCEGFTAQIIQDGNDLIAVTSFGTTGLTHTWTTNDPTFTLPAGDTLTLPDPNLSISTVTVTAKVTINGSTCTDTAVYQVMVTDTPIINTPTYTCEKGLQFNDDGSGIVYRDEDLNILAASQRLAEDVSFKITAESAVHEEVFFITIPACYACPDCLQDPAGLYASLSECNQECENCDDPNVFDANVVIACEGNAAKVTMTINAGSPGATGFQYSITANDVQFETGTFTGTQKIVTGIPQGDITVNVGDGVTNCQKNESLSIDCVNCLTNDGTVSIDNLDTSNLCNGGASSLSFQATSQNPSPYPMSAKIFEGASLVTQKTVTGQTASFSGLSLTNGSYILELTDAYGCKATQSFDVSCVEANCEPYGLIFPSFSAVTVGNDVLVSVTWEADLALPVGAALFFEQSFDAAATCDISGTWLSVGAVVDLAGQSSGTASTTNTSAAGIPACYRARIEFMSGASTCEYFISQSYSTLAPPAQECEICTPLPAAPCNEISWADDELTISWCFQNSPSSFVITVTDPAGLTLFGNGTNTKTITSGSSSSTGTLILDCPATSANRTVNVDFETGQAACDYNCDVTVTACSCSISNLTVTPIPVNGFLQLEFDTTCTSGTLLVSTTGDFVTSTVLEQSDGVGVGVSTTPVNYIWDVSGDYPTGGGNITVQIEDNDDGACLVSEAVVLPSTCTCSLSAANYDFDIDTLELTFDLTVADCLTSSVNIQASDNTGAFVLSPVNPIAVTAGANAITLTLDRAPESNISILIEDAADATCLTADNVDTCTITDPGTLASEDIFAEWEVLFSDNPSNGDTITTDDGGASPKTYTFQTVLTDVDGNIQIGASAIDTAQNFLDAVNLTGTAGTQYAASMTANTDVVASAGSGITRVDLTSNVAGTAGQWTMADTGADIFISLKKAGTDGGFYQTDDILDGNPAVYGTQGALIYDNIGPIVLTIDASNNYTFEYPTAGGQATISGTNTNVYAALKNTAISHGAYETEAQFLGGEIVLDTFGIWASEGTTPVDSFSASACINIAVPGDYFIAFSIDNTGVLKIDNETIIDLSAVSSGASVVNQRCPFIFTFIAKVNLTAGDHLLTLEASNNTSAQSVQYMVINETLAGITGAGSSAALTLISDSSVATGDLDNTISEGIQGGVECTSGDLWYDTCVPKCTDCYE